jgi:hypothetical protein
VTADEAKAYCEEGLHIRDTTYGTCLECGEHDDQPGQQPEPPRGSVVLTEGPTGTAWQRFNSDGRWHSTTGKSTPWDRLIRSDKPGGRLRVIYLPPRSS